MQKRSRVEINYHQPRFTQISESHCGPAVVQMMLSFLGIDVTQEEITSAAGVADRLELHGTRPDQLAQAVSRLASGARFFIKDHASLDDLVKAVNDYQYPTGVEWQGLFEGEPESEDAQAAGMTLPDSESEDSDYGHYSLVISAQPQRRVLVIADPYKDYAAQDRIFTFREFEHRWFDYNEVVHPRTGRQELVKDDHLMFVVVPQDETFPYELGMKPVP